jgi:hypothetical protein
MEKIEQEIAKVNSDIETVTKQIETIGGKADKAEVAVEEWKQRNNWNENSALTLQNNAFYQDLKEKENKLREKENKLRDEKNKLREKKNKLREKENKLRDEKNKLTGAIQTTHEVLKMTFAKVKENVIWSSKYTSTSVAAKYLMSPLMLLQWDDFSTNVQSCATHFPDISLDDPFIPLYEGESCSGEAGVHALGDYTLFKAIRILMKTLSKHYEEEEFKNLFSFFSACFIIKEGKFNSIEGRGAIGDPDRLWTTLGYKLAKLIVEYKTPWSLGEIEDLVSEYQIQSKGWKLNPLQQKGNIMRAVEQTYIYMTINRHRYGCLTTFNQTWFLKRVEDAANPDTSLLYISPAISCSSIEPYTLTSAWLFILLTIEKDSGWLYSSPRSSAVAIPFFRAGKESFKKDRYTSIVLDGLIHWNNIIARSQAGAVATGRFMDVENVVFKTIDISKKEGGLDQFNHELSIYRDLEDLQGNVIPRLIAYGNLGGLLQVIVLENVGKSITREQAEQKHDEINAALQRIHENGVVHGDLRLPNILIDKENNVRIIDFGMSSKQEGNITETFLLDSNVQME